MIVPGHPQIPVSQFQEVVADSFGDCLQKSSDQAGTPVSHPQIVPGHPHIPVSQFQEVVVDVFGDCLQISIDIHVADTPVSNPDVPIHSQDQVAYLQEAVAGVFGDSLQKEIVEPDFLLGKYINFHSWLDLFLKAWLTNVTNFSMSNQRFYFILSFLNSPTPVTWLCIR